MLAKELGGDYAMSMFRKLSFVLLPVIAVVVGCEEKSDEKDEKHSGESALTREGKIRELEADLEVAKWENVRLGLKLRKVDGASLVRDKQTNFNR